MRSPGGPRPEICNPTKLVQPGCHMEPWVGLAAGSAGRGPAGRPAVHRSTARPPPGHGPPPPCQRKAALWGKESLPIWPPEWVAGYLRGGSPRELQRQAGEGTAGPWASAGPPRAGRRRWPRARTSAPPTHRKGGKHRQTASQFLSAERSTSRVRSPPFQERESPSRWFMFSQAGGWTTGGGHGGR